MKEVIQIGLAGLGTVGGGTYAVLKRNAKDLQAATGSRLVVKTVACRNLERARGQLDADVAVTNDVLSLAHDPDIGVVVEVMGGIEPARTLVLEAIAAGKHVVTANKALLALHGNEIFEAAQRAGVVVAFEAAVAGGIPIIKALREGLAANRIEWVVGIINGTSNFILTTMREKGISFDEALAQAQKLGYAEADPTFDIEGIDAAHKITLLSALAFHTPVNFKAATVEGINHLAAEDIEYAEEFGYRIKLLGITKRTEKGIELRVHPALVPKRRLMANVEGVMNAVVVKGDAVGTTLYHGRGAGAEPTASAVIADLVDIARLLRGKRVEPAYLSQRMAAMGPQGETVWLPMDETVSSYYLRIGVADRPGVLADIARIFAENDISIETMVQRGSAPGEESTEIVILTHSAVEGRVRRAIAAIEALDHVHGRVVMLRKEEMN